MIYKYTVPAVPNIIGIYSTSLLEIELGELIEHVSHHMGVEKELLYNKNRHEKLKYCRWFVWEISCAAFQIRVVDACNIFGDHDHSTVVNALNNLPYDLEHKQCLQMAYDATLRDMNIPMSTIEAFRRNRYNSMNGRIKKLALLRKMQEERAKMREVAPQLLTSDAVRVKMLNYEQSKRNKNLLK